MLNDITASQVQMMQSVANSRLGALVNTVHHSIEKLIVEQGLRHMMLSNAAQRHWYNETGVLSLSGLESTVNPKLRKQLERQHKRLKYSRQARRAVRLYYGMPKASANVANALIDWLQSDTCGSMQKRKEWRERVWQEWDNAAIMRSVASLQVNPFDTPFMRHIVSQSVTDSLHDFAATYGGCLTRRIVYRRGNFVETEENPYAETVHNRT